MKLEIHFKNQDLPFVTKTTESAKGILSSIVESNDDTLRYNNDSTIRLKEEFSNIKSITIKFD
ncbi:hypothetical protein ACWKTJ_27365 [Bacillus wiedmannii]|uniref:hypothetical protein n=1 Tax=Bacillus anthracis TaxID=1392 RepID=UPI00207A35A0|nr:hypothetical protein [Bacillus anthracis]USL02184.1 hypothetical protein LIS83_25540 [Bacillus anthracis]